MRKSFIPAIVIVILVIVASQLLLPMVQAQSEIQCGDILKNNFTKNGEFHKYIINLNAGDITTVSAQPLGDTLQVQFALFDPVGNKITSWTYSSSDPSFTSGVLSATGNYTIQAGAYRGVGVYTLYVECTKGDTGEIIKPGAAQTPVPVSPATESPTEATPLPQAAAVTPEFADVGFPGLSPVDFSNVVRLNLANGVPISATLTPGFEDIVGFTVNAEPDDVLDLTYTRLSGNLNLGLVVLFPKNQVYFQSSLVTSDRLNTRLTLPVAGQYTIGVFQINLVEPAIPEDTAFELIGRLNPE